MKKLRSNVGYSYANDEAECRTDRAGMKISKVEMNYWTDPSQDYYEHSIKGYQINVNQNCAVPLFTGMEVN